MCGGSGLSCSWSRCRVKRKPTSSVSSAGVLVKVDGLTVTFVSARRSHALTSYCLSDGVLLVAGQRSETYHKTLCETIALSSDKASRVIKARCISLCLSRAPVVRPWLDHVAPRSRISHLDKSHTVRRSREWLE